MNKHEMPRGNFSELIIALEEAIEQPIVTTRFGDMWKSYAVEHIDFPSLVNIAWKQGRRAILLERMLEGILKQRDDLQEVMNDIRDWSDIQFGEGERNPAIAYHLLEEVSELIEAIVTFQEGNSVIHVPKSEGLLKQLFFEYADCFMLLLDSASHMGLTADILMDFTRRKLEINKARKWGEPDKNGVVKHIEESAIKNREEPDKLK